MSVRDTTTGAVLCTVPCTDAEDAYFSPLGTFVVAFSTPKRGTATSDPRPNLCIFRVRCLARFVSVRTDVAPACAASHYWHSLRVDQIGTLTAFVSPRSAPLPQPCSLPCCPAKVCDGGAAASMEASFHLKRLTHGALAVQVTMVATTKTGAAVCCVACAISSSAHAPLHTP